MNCPDCGHPNLPGADACEQCGQDLRSIDIARPRPRAQRRILETTLRDMDPPEALTVAADEPLADVIRKMQKSGHGSALVVEDGAITGIFTERDLLINVTGRSLDLKTTPVSAAMTADPRVLTDEDTLAIALHFMAVGSYRHIPVVGPGHAPRFVSIRGVLRYLNDHAR